MNTALQEIKDAWQNRPAAGTASSSEDGEALSAHDKDVVALADSYVTAHPELFSQFEGKDEHFCVRALEVAREQGLEESEWQIQAWLFHRFEFQNIGGVSKAQVRLAPEGNE